MRADLVILEHTSIPFEFHGITMEYLRILGLGYSRYLTITIEYLAKIGEYYNYRIVSNTIEYFHKIWE